MEGVTQTEEQGRVSDMMRIAGWEGLEDQSDKAIRCEGGMHVGRLRVPDTQGAGATNALERGAVGPASVGPGMVWIIGQVGQSVSTERRLLGRASVCRYEILYWYCRNVIFRS